MARKQLVDIDMNGRKVTNLGTPSNPADAVPKSYVDALPTGGGDVVSDTSPQLGGDLDSNTHNILMSATNYIEMGGSQMRMFGDPNTIGNGAILFTGATPEMQRSFYFSGPVSFYSNAGATGQGISAPEFTMYESEVQIRANGVTDAIFSVNMDGGMQIASNGTYGKFLTDNLTALRTYQLPDGDGVLQTDASLASAGYLTASSTNTFTNKTFNAGVNGNVFQINGTAISGVTGTGNNVLATSPTLITPTLGVATATSINKVTITAPTTSATLTLAQGSTLATSGAFSTTLTATAATNVTLPTTGTLATRAGVETLTNKTLTAPVISSISNTGTLTLPTSSDTLVGRATTDALTNKDLTSGTNTFPTFNQNTTGTAAGITGKTTPTGAIVGTTDAQTLTNKNLADSTNTVAFRRVVHGATASTARPNATHVEWVGSVAPTNATSVDTWIDTA